MVSGTRLSGTNYISNVFPKWNTCWIVGGYAIVQLHMYLVGGFNPSEKYLSNEIIVPNVWNMEKCRMFQTTNQILYPSWDISQVYGKTWHSTCPASATAGKQQSSQAFAAAVESFNGRFMGTWWTNFISLGWFSRENLQETMVFTLKYQWIFHWDYHQWIGFHGKILSGNHGKITIKYRAFRLKFSHHPILWSYWYLGLSWNLEMGLSENRVYFQW